MTPKISMDKQVFAHALEHPIMRNFLAHPINAILMKQFVDESNLANLERVDRAFRKYLFAVRFTKYLSKLIQNGCIDYMRGVRRNEERELVVYDQPVSAEDKGAVGEVLTKVYHGDDLPQVTVNPNVFQEQINHEWLYEAFSQLTNRQKYVITLAYSAMSRDSEIALLLHVSQQSVSKTRTTALRNMRRTYQCVHGPDIFENGG